MEVVRLAEAWETLGEDQVAHEEAEARFQYDSIEAERLQAAEATLPGEYTSAACTLLNAVAQRALDGVGAGAEGVAETLAEDLAAWHAAHEAASVDLHDCLQLTLAGSEVALAFQEAAMHAPRGAEVAQLLFADAADSWAEAQEADLAGDVAQQEVAFLRAHATLAALHPGAVPDAFSCAIRALRRALALQGALTGPNSADVHLLQREAATVAAGAGAWAVAACQLRAVLTREAAALAGADGVDVPVDAEGHFETARSLVQLLLQLADWATDPVAAVGGDEAEAARLAALQATDDAASADGLEQASVEQLLTLAREAAQGVLSGALTAAPATAGTGAGPARFADWAALLGEGVDVVTELSVALQERGMGDDTLVLALRDMLARLEAVGQSLRDGIAGAEGEEGKRLTACAVELQAAHAAFTGRLTDALEAAGRQEEMAAVLDEQLTSLLEGRDALTEALLASQAAGGSDSDRVALARARQVLLSGLRGSAAWGRAQRWDAAERCSRAVVDFLAAAQGTAGNAPVPRALFSLTPLEVAVLAAMGHKQLARAAAEQGRTDEYFTVLEEELLPPLGAALAAHGTEAAVQGDDPRAVAVALAVLHTGAELAAEALCELARHVWNDADSVALTRVAAALKAQLPALREWAALATRLLQAGPQLAALQDSGQHAGSAGFLWRLPQLSGDVHLRLAEAEFCAGLLLQRAADAAAAAHATECGSWAAAVLSVRAPVPVQDAWADGAAELSTAAMHFAAACDSLLCMAVEVEDVSLGALAEGDEEAEEEDAPPTVLSWNGVLSEPLPLWTLEAAALALDVQVRGGGADWEHVHRVGDAFLRTASPDAVDGNARVALAVSTLQRTVALAMCHTAGVDEGAAFARGVERQLAKAAAAAAADLHAVEDEGADDATLAKTARRVLLLQQLHVAAACDGAAMAAVLQAADPEEARGNPVAERLQVAMRAVDDYGPYRGAEEAYPAAAFSGFPLHTWAAGPAVAHSHLQCLFATVLDASMAAADAVAPQELWHTPCMDRSPHPFLRGRSERVRSAEGAVDGAVGTAYITAAAAQPAEAQAAVAAAEAAPGGPLGLQAVGVLHRLGAWLETQPFAGAVPAAGVALANAHFAAGNVFEACGNAAGTARARRKAVAVLRQLTDAAGAADADRDTLAVLEAALADALDEQGAAALASGMPGLAWEAFSQARQRRGVLYDATDGASPAAASAVNARYVWGTLAGQFEAALQRGAVDSALDAADAQRFCVEAVAGATPCTLWHAVAAFNTARALAAGEQWGDASRCFGTVVREAASALEGGAVACAYAADGSSVEEDGQLVWCAPGALFSPLLPLGHGREALLRALQERAHWHAAEAHHSAFHLAKATASFRKWLALRDVSEPARVEAVGDVEWDDGAAAERAAERGDVLAGLAAVQVAAGDVEGAMESLEGAQAARGDTLGLLAPQYTETLAAIARHFLTHAADAAAAASFLQHPLGLLHACLLACAERLEGSDDEEEEEAAAALCSAMDAAALGPLPPLAELLPPPPEDVDVEEVLLWQLQSTGLPGAAAVEAVQAQLRRQLAALLYHVGLARALEARLPQPPSALQLASDVSVVPAPRHAAALALALGLEAGEVPTAVPEDSEDEEGAEAADAQAAATALLAGVRLATAHWRHAVRLELAVEGATPHGEYTPPVVQAQALTRMGHVLHSVVGDSARAVPLLRRAVGDMDTHAALAAATARGVRPTAAVLLASAEGQCGDWGASAAAAAACVEALAAAKAAVDGRAGVNLLAAMQVASLLAQLEAMALTHQAAVAEAQGQLDAALACLRAAQRVLEPFGGAATAHTARILPWDPRLVALLAEQGRILGELGDSVQGEHLARSATVLQEQRIAELGPSPPLTSAMQAAARAAVW